MSFTFDPTERAVFWGTKRLNDDQCDRLLDLFDELGDVRAFNDLYSAHLKAGGIARVCSLRRAA